MDSLLEQQRRLAEKANYSKAIENVQEIIELLAQTRDSISSDPSTAALTLAKVKAPIKKSWDRANDNLKQVHSALKEYNKALEKKCKTQSLPDVETYDLQSQAELVNRAIAMHLLREGQFDVASTFISESNSIDPPKRIHSPLLPSSTSNLQQQHDWELRPEELQKEFSEMYEILNQLRQEHNLDPAIKWATANSEVLERRGSNLEFELCRLRFIGLFAGSHSSFGDEPPKLRAIRASQYARRAFPAFQFRYSAEIQQLLGAVAYWQNIGASPYSRIFAQDSVWDDVATSFTKEFCSLLGLSAESPLYIAVTAGAVALPYLIKVQNLMRLKRGKWTTVEELPVEIPLPPSFNYHSIFVCPVSKEQATDSNPPMMLPCYHVICKDSLEKISNNQRFKCPYCPMESVPRDATKVFL